jgi:hypothetical protein
MMISRQGLVVLDWKSACAIDPVGEHHVRKHRRNSRKSLLEDCVVPNRWLSWVLQGRSV